MSPMKHQQLINLISKLDLPAERVQALREDMRALRYGLINWGALTDWINCLMQGYHGPPGLKFGVFSPR